MGELGDVLRQLVMADDEGFSGVVEGAAEAADRLEERVARLEAEVLPQEAA